MKVRFRRVCRDPADRRRWIRKRLPLRNQPRIRGRMQITPASFVEELDLPWIQDFLECRFRCHDRHLGEGLGSAEARPWARHSRNLVQLATEVARRRLQTNQADLTPEDVVDLHREIALADASPDEQELDDGAAIALAWWRAFAGRMRVVAADVPWRIRLEETPPIPGSWVLRGRAVAVYQAEAEPWSHLAVPILAPKPWTTRQLEGELAPVWHVAGGRLGLGLQDLRSVSLQVVVWPPEGRAGLQVQDLEPVVAEDRLRGFLELQMPAVRTALHDALYSPSWYPNRLAPGCSRRMCLSWRKCVETFGGDIPAHEEAAQGPQEPARTTPR